MPIQHPSLSKAGRMQWIPGTLVGLCFMVLAACDTGGEQAPVAEPQRRISTGVPEQDEKIDEDLLALSNQAKALFGPLPQFPLSDDNRARIDLGRRLYYDKRLSMDRDISCNTCHQLNQFGVDNQPTSAGHQDQQGERNTPTVYNASLHIAQSWDGRAADLGEQIRGHVLNPAEMAIPSEGMIVTKIALIPGYVALFEVAFPEDKPALTFDNMVKAIAAFAEGLLTPGRFDAFMQGDLDALRGPEVYGLETFIRAGCGNCHNGPAVGGNMYQKLGMVKPYEIDDPGRFAVTGNEADEGVFKVPGLRNVARTAPYLHDGSITPLTQTIRIMAEHQLGKTLSDADVISIAMFLESLTGIPDKEYIAEPDLPGDGEARILREPG